MNIYHRPDCHKYGVPMSNFTWEVVGKILIIEDLNLNGGQSVTNDVREVCEHIRSAEGKDIFDDLAGIIYRDSEGTFDEIQKDRSIIALRNKVEGTFLEITDKAEAIAAIRKRKGLNWKPDEIDI